MKYQMEYEDDDHLFQNIKNAKDNGSLKPELLARHRLLELKLFEPAREVEHAALGICHYADDKFIEELVSDLAGKYESTEGQVQLVGWLVRKLAEARRPIPAVLGQFAQRAMTGQLTIVTQGGRTKEFKRDYVIANSVLEVLHWFPDIKPTRNQALRESGNDKQSACSIVTRELEKLNHVYREFPRLSETNVEKIWNIKKKQAFG